MPDSLLDSLRKRAEILGETPFFPNGQMALEDIIPGALEAASFVPTIFGDAAEAARFAYELRNEEFREQLDNPPTVFEDGPLDVNLFGELEGGRQFSLNNPQMQGLFALAPFFHGTPHKFTKFDSSKIGTGEGAQAFGHGLYFAENPAVAKTYRLDNQRGDFYVKTPTGDSHHVLYDEIDRSDFLKNVADITENLRVAGLPEVRDDLVEQALERLGAANGDLNKALRDLPESQREIRDIFEKLTAEPGGSLLEVDIPDEAIERMLDWDKPLSEQPEIVAAMPENIQARIRSWQSSFGAENVKGENLYDGIIADEVGKGGFGARPEQSAFLNERGIPGIKYFDGNSRTAGEGTRNIVVFDDTLPTIKNDNK